MPTVDFSQFAYYPALTCTEGEHIGYKNLSQSDRETLLPIFEVAYRTNATSMDESVDAIRQAVPNLPFILDLNKTPAPSPYIPKPPKEGNPQRIAFATEAQRAYNGRLQDLFNASNGFQAWREFVATFPNAVPSIIYRDVVTEATAILRQASLLSRGGGSLAIRVVPEMPDEIYKIILRILSILDGPEQLLIILDCGQNRTDQTTSENFVRSSIAHIALDTDLQNWPQLRFVCMSNSFPTKLTHDNLVSFDAFDWNVWRETKDACPSAHYAFGDYGAHARYHSATTYMPPKWRPTVVFPLEEGWLIYRHPNAGDREGWIEGARQIIAHERYEKGVEAWGHTLIRRAAQGNIRDCGSQRFWHAAKTNIHLHRQIHYAAANIADFADDSEE